MFGIRFIHFQKTLSLILVLQFALPGIRNGFAFDPPDPGPGPGPFAEALPAEPPIAPPQDILETLRDLERCFNYPACHSDSTAHSDGAPYRLVVDNPCEPSPERVHRLRNYMEGMRSLNSMRGQTNRSGSVLAFTVSALLGAAAIYLSVLTLQGRYSINDTSELLYFIYSASGIAGLAGISARQIIETELAQTPMGRGLMETGYDPARVQQLLRAQEARLGRGWLRTFTNAFRRRGNGRTGNARQVALPSSRNLPTTAANPGVEPPSANRVPVNPTAATPGATTPAAPTRGTVTTAAATPSAATPASGSPTSAAQNSTANSQAPAASGPPRVRVVLDGDGTPCVDPTSIDEAAGAAYDELAELQALADRARGGRTQRTATPLVAPATTRRPRRVIINNAPAARAPFQNSVDASGVLSDAPAIMPSAATGATDGLRLPILAPN